MEFKKGTKTFTSAGEEIGAVDRVVIDPRSKVVTHIVVRKGLFFVEDKVISVRLIASATEDRVTLTDKVGSLTDLPPFEETHYIPWIPKQIGSDNPADPDYALLGYPPMGNMWGGYFVPPYTIETERHIPDQTVALKEGARVLSSDDKHVGNVERVFTDPDSHRATHLLISQGLLLKEHKLIPALWVERIQENEVQLAVDSDLLDRLEPYEEPAQP